MLVDFLHQVLDEPHLQRHHLAGRRHALEADTSLSTHLASWLAAAAAATHYSSRQRPLQAHLVRPGAPLEGHLLHVLAVVLRDAAGLDEGADQVVFDGPELGAPGVPLAHRTTRSHSQMGTPEAEESAPVCTCMP